MKKTKIGNVAKALSFWLLFEGLLFALNASFFNMPKWLVAIVFGGALSLLMIFLSSLYLKSDKMTMADLGMTLAPGSYRRFAVSLLVGMAFFGGFFVLYLLLAPVAVARISEPDLFNATVLAFFAMLALGTMEEIVFRGYFLRKLDTAIGVRAAIYLSSIAFGLYHGLTIDSITGPAIWGLIYGVLAYWSKGLAIPIGFHVGANLIQSLFSQKERWVSGIWTFDVSEATTLFTVEQVTTGLQIFLLIFAVGLLEYYLRRVHRP